MFGHRLEREILDALADGTPSYAVDLAATIDEHPVAVEHACDRLHEDGRFGRSAASGTRSLRRVVTNSPVRTRSPSNRRLRRRRKVERKISCNGDRIRSGYRLSS